MVVDQQLWSQSKKEIVFWAALSRSPKDRHEGMAGTGAMVGLYAPVANTAMVTCCLSEATLSHLKVKRDDGS